MANEIAVQKQGIASFMNSEEVHKNIVSVVGENEAQKFISSLVSAVQTNPELQKCTNKSLLSVALLGHSLKLPQSPQLGMFYFVPYKIKDETYEAQFQLSFKGYIQLAQRSGEYRKLNVTDVREGEFVSLNPLTEEIELKAETDFIKRNALPVIGYYANFELMNGYKKWLYWSVDQLREHGKRYSASFRKGWSSSLWISDFDSMCRKTMLRQLISKWGVMSVDVQSGYQNDMAVIRDDKPVYIDNVPDEPEKATDIYAEAEVIESEVIEDENNEA